MPVNMTLDRFHRIFSTCFCKECGSVLEPSPSGAICQKHKIVHGVIGRDLRSGEIEFVKEVIRTRHAMHDKSTGAWQPWKLSPGEETLYVVPLKLWTRSFATKPPKSMQMKLVVRTKHYVQLRYFIPLRYLLAAL